MRRILPQVWIPVRARLIAARAVDARSGAREREARLLPAHARHADADAVIPCGHRVLKLAKHPRGLVRDGHVPPPQAPLKEGLGS